MKKKDRNMLILGLVVAVLLAHQFGYITIPGLPRLQTGGETGTQTTETWDQTQRENYLKGIGTFTCLAKAYDTCVLTTSRTIGTNFNVKLYKNHGGQWIPGPTLDSDGENFELQSIDNGYGWFVWTIPSGQAYYVDYQKIADKTRDPYIVGYQYVDVDGDTVKEFAFQYDFKNHAIPASGYPEVTMTGYLITYDSSFTGINDLSNSTGISTTTTTKYYDYYLAFSDVNKGVAIYQAEVKAQTTDITRVRFKYLEIPGLGNLPASSFSFYKTSSELIWTKTFSSNFDNALYLTYKTGQNNRFDTQLTIEYTLQDGDDILITITFYYLVAQTEAGASTSDTFYAQE